MTLKGFCEKFPIPSLNQYERRFFANANRATFRLQISLQMFLWRMHSNLYVMPDINYISLNVI